MSAHRGVLGLDHDDTPIVEPKPSHSLILAAAGSGKSTCGVVPMLMSFLGDPSVGMVVLDSKNGELAAQCVPACLAAGRKVAVVDPSDVLNGIEGTISLNPLNGLIWTHHNKPKGMMVATENVNHALIPEPASSGGGDDKNKFWRESPRLILETIERALLKMNDGHVTVGMLWLALTNIDETLRLITDSADDDDDVALSTKAKQIEEMISGSPKEWSQHHSAALEALRLYEAGGFLHDVGSDAGITHEKLLREKYVTFIVGEQRYIDRMGSFYALHLQSFIDAQLSGGVGRTEFLLDEFTNAPLQKLIDAMTIIRGFGGSFRLIAQSRSEIERKFGDKQTRTIEENAITQQWFGFSSFEEAKRVSDAMGLRDVVKKSHSSSSDNDAINTTTSREKEPLMSVTELMTLGPDEQIIRIKDHGWIRCRKVRQDMISPYAHDLGDNPLEGAQFPPNIKVRLPFPDGYSGRAPRREAKRKRRGWFK